jgi:hypothetical protein
VIEHVCVPLAVLITRLTLAPAVRVILAPLGAVAVTLLFVGPKTALLTTLRKFTDAEKLKLAVMLSRVDGVGCHRRRHRMLVCELLWWANDERHAVAPSRRSE